MGFDKQSDQQVVNTAKKTTQVNLWLAAGVVLFLALCGGSLLWIHSHSRVFTQDVKRSEDTPKPSHE